MIYLVFEGFRFSLLDWNPERTLAVVVLIFQHVSHKVGADVITVVLSANLTSLAVLSQLLMSLTSIKNRMGPRIDPCHTQSFTSNLSKTTPFRSGEIGEKGCRRNKTLAKSETRY